MHRLLLAATAAAFLAGAPASSGQPAERPRDGPQTLQNFSSSLSSRSRPAQCFDGRQIVGASRGADNLLYVQINSGAVFQLQLADDCADLSPTDLSVAGKLTVRGAGSSVCTGARATVDLAGPAPRRCRAQTIRTVNRDTAALAEATTR